MDRGELPVGIKVLLVEDDPDDRDLAQRALERSKVANEMTWVESGEEALAYLSARLERPESLPDLILLDLNLPGMHGSAVLSGIKSDPRLATIPVVILTTSNAEADVARAYSLHANCYITKPVDLHQFLRVVQAIDDFWVSIVRLPRRG